MAISNIWKIKGATGTATPFGERNLGSVRATRASLAPDTVSFRQIADYDADPEFDYGEAVTVLRDGATWFKGICMAPRRQGGGRSESINYQLKGPWWQLEQVIYQQNYVRYVSGVQTITPLAKLILGADSAGGRLNSGQVITNVVNYAITQLGASALFTLGTVAPTTQMPYEELNALSCAEVIKRVLRWNPDIVGYFDYSAATPTLNFVKRSSLTSKTFTLADVEITDNSINPRNDLQKDGVVIKYERTDTVDNQEYKNIITDEAGVISDPATTLNLFFDLQGSSVSYLRQRIVVANINESSAAWWKARHPKLHNATVSTVAESEVTALDDEDEGGENDGTTYSKELMVGNIADWMDVGVNTQIVEAEVTYTPDGGSEVTEKLRLSLQGTAAISKIYSTLGSANPAEPTPSGLAAAILASLSTLQYEGTVSTKKLDVGVEPLINTKVNITGGRSAWASMDAQVYSVAFDLDTGTTTVNFGPAKHLGYSDLFQLFRNVRTRKGGLGSVRSSPGGGGNDLPTRGPNTSTADDGGDAGPDGIYLISQDRLTTVFLPKADILAGYDPAIDTNWSINLTVSNLSWDGISDNITYSNIAVEIDALGDSQTVCRIPIYRDGKFVAKYGVYQEGISKVLAGIFVEFYAK